MKERRNTSLLKRLAAVVLCICMITVTFGTAVFAEKGTASTTDDLFLTMEDFTGLGATVGEVFNSATLKTLSGGMMTGNNVGYYIVNEDGSFTAKREAGQGATQATYIDFGEVIDWETCEGTVKASIAMEPPAMEVAEGKTAAGYGNTSFYFFGKNEEGARSGQAAAINFDTNGKHIKINSNSTNSLQFDSQNDIDYDADGLYEFRIEISKAYGIATTTGTTEVPYWAVKVFSEEEGSENTQIFYINAGVESAVGNMQLPNIAGFAMNLYTNGAADNNGSAAYNSSFDIHDINISIDRFKATSASDSLFYDGGSATVNFNYDLPETVTGITMTDAGGNSVPVNVTTSGREAIVTPTVDLKNGDTYKINVANAVMSAEGYIATASEFEVIANNIFYQPDIAGWNTTSGTMLTAANVNSLSDGDVTGSFNATSTMTGWLVEDGAISSSNINKQSNYIYTDFNFGRDFNTLNMKGNIEFDFDLKSQKLYSVSTTDGVTTFTENTEGTQAGANSWIGIRGIDGTGAAKSLPLFSICADGSLNGQVAASWCGTYGRVPKASAATLDGKWYKLKAVISSTPYTSGDGTEYVWKVELKDRNNSNNTLITYYYTAAEFASINSIRHSVYEANATYRNDGLYWKTTIKNPVASVTPFALAEIPGDKISMKAETLDIIFNCDVDEDTLNAITLKNAKGTDIVTNRSVSGNVVTLSFDTLEYGASYTLDIANTLKSVEGYSIEVCSYPMIAEYIAETEVLYQEDYSKWGATNGVALTSSTISNYTDNAITLSSTSVGYIYGDTFVYARTYQNNASPDTSFFNFTKSVKWAEMTGDIEFTFDLKKERFVEATKDSDGVVSWTDCTNTGGTGARKFGLRYNNSSGTTTGMHLFGLTNSTGDLGSSGGDITCTAYTTQPSVDSDGFYNLKLVISPTSTENQWTVTSYDRITGNKIATVTVSDAEEILGYHLYTYQDNSSRTYKVTTTNEETGESTETTVHKYLRTLLRNPRAIIYPFEMKTPENTELPSFADTLEVAFTYDILDSSVNENTITLTDSTGKNVITDYSVSGNILTLSYDWLEVGESYTLKVMYGIKSAKGMDVVPREIVFTAVENPPLFYQDFSDFTAGTYTETQVQAINPSISVDGEGTFTSDGTGLTYTIPTTGGVQDDDFEMKFTENVSVGTVAVDLKLKVESFSSTGSGIYKDIYLGGNKILRLQVDGDGFRGSSMGGLFTGVGSEGNYQATPNLITETLNGTSYVNMKIVASRTSTDDVWGVVVYDNNNGLKPLVISKMEASANAGSIAVRVRRDQGAFNATSIAPVTLAYVKAYKANDADAVYGGQMSSATMYPTLAVDTENNAVTWHGTVYSRNTNNTYAKILVAAYDEENNLLDVAFVPETTLWTNTSAQTVLTVDESEGTIHHAKMFVFNNLDDITPLMDAIDSK